MPFSHARSRRIARFSLFVALAAAVAPVAASAATTGPTAPAGVSMPVDNRQASLALNYLVRTTGNVDELGQVIAFAGNFAPTGWSVANGALLPVATNGQLFNKLGYSYGGNGVVFALPDLRGRLAAGGGQGAGLTNRPIGGEFGEASTTLISANLPAHVHAYSGGVSSVAGGSVPFTNAQPSLALTYGIADTGIFPSSDPGNSGGYQPTYGGLVTYAGSTLPNGIVPAVGALLPIQTHQPLFSLTGTTYGGDGRTTFAVPDLRGRAPVGVGPVSNGALDVARTHLLGEASGAETTTLTNVQLPTHVHVLPAGMGTTGAAGGGSAIDNEQPTLGLQYAISLGGIYPPRDEDAPGTTGGIGIDRETYVGEVGLFALNFVPRGWAACDGRLLSISQNLALFSILGVTYGGDGRTTFALPDLRGRVIVGADNESGSPYALGATFGDSSLTLTEAQMAAHVHDVLVPEPATLAALVVGGALMRRRRRAV